MNTDCLSLARWRRGLTVLADKWGQSSSMAKAELPVVAITVPILVVLVVSLGIALGLPLLLTQVLATILALALVSPFMLRRMLSSTLIEIDGTPFTSLMNRVVVASNCCGEADYVGWYGQMVLLTSDELEFLSELVGSYLEDNDDLNHAEFGFAKGVLDKVEEAMDV